MGDLDCGRGLTIPLYAQFNTEITGASPYLGYGWWLPLLEAQLIPLDENTWKIREPTSLYRIYRRNRDYPSVFEGGAGWKAEARPDGGVAVWAECGAKMVFNRGRLRQLTLNGRRLDYVWSGDRVARINEGTRTLLEVMSDRISGTVTGLKLADGTMVTLECSPRPRVIVSGGKRIAVGMEPSLSRFVRPDGASQSFAYSVDEDGRPVMTRANGWETVWDPQTLLMARDGRWTYRIQPPAIRPLGNAAIERRNEKGETEYWFYDRPAGCETIRGTDGVVTTRTWFAAGALKGRQRQEKVQLKDGTCLVYKASYDEKGRVIREVRKDGRVDMHEYDDAGRRVRTTCLRDNQIETVTTLDPSHSRKVVRDRNGRQVEYFYDKQGREVRTLINGCLHAETSYAQDGRSRCLKLYSQDGRTVERTIYHVFNAHGRIALIRHVSDDPARPLSGKTRFVYDDQHRPIRVENEGGPTLLYEYAPDGTRRVLRGNDSWTMPGAPLETKNPAPPDEGGVGARDTGGVATVKATA